ncbi:MAG TPA: penicillin acylase family protein [Terriglobales bacterium]
MKKLMALGVFVAIGLAAPVLGQSPSSAEMARLKSEAQHVTIVRDDWGIAHIHGKTDADTVFGMEYAQAEDDFNRVETNYINSIGRLAEADGESAIWQDLRMKLFINPDDMKAQYASSPDWLKALMNGFADGLNYYLATHPSVHPRVITHFEPWMALTFSEGSIGGDIERARLPGLQAFYDHPAAVGGSEPPPAPYDPYRDAFPPEPGGSNGIAIAPARTADHHALLYINPHTSFYFRSELEMTSDQGLHAYGAVTWGQFFIYQGFNDRIGWMHTSSGANAVDFYLETISEKDGKFFYKYGDQELPVRERTIVVPYKTANGMAQRTFRAFFTQHGPVIGAVNGKWESIALMQEPEKALIQSYTRTKALNYKAFRQIMEDFHTNSSNNTIYADADGNIAYFHGNFLPRRDDQFDWTKPVDGSNPATAWGKPLSVDQSPHLLNPASGWLYNSNNWPWSAAGPSSPKAADFPKYVDNGREESPRGYHALHILPGANDLTVQGLINLGFDSWQPWFAQHLPRLIAAWDAAPASDPLKAQLAEPIALMRHWDYRWGADSVPTSVAVYFGSDIKRAVAADARRAGKSDDDYVKDGATNQQLLQSLAAGCAKLKADFGSWKTPWGEINRFQRLDDSILKPRFDDSLPSTPVPFTTATWGSLASFAAHQYPGTKRIYGSSGNSFVAAIDFGPKITARAVTAGGESGNPASPHFKDEAERYASGNLREVYFYPAQLKGHTERTYHPGE